MFTVYDDNVRLYLVMSILIFVSVFRLFFFQAEDGIRDLVRSRGLGDVYKRQVTVTVLGTQVTDLDTDEPPDNMAADFTFDFTIVLSLIHI